MSNSPHDPGPGGKPEPRKDLPRPGDKPRAPTLSPSLSPSVPPIRPAVGTAPGFATPKAAVITEAAPLPDEDEWDADNEPTNASVAPVVPAHPPATPSPAAGSLAPGRTIPLSPATASTSSSSAAGGQTMRLHSARDVRPVPSVRVTDTPKPPEGFAPTLRDEVTAALRVQLPRAVEAEIAPLLKVQHEMQARLERLEASLRVATSSWEAATHKVEALSALAAAASIAPPPPAPSPPPVVRRAQSLPPAPVHAGLSAPLTLSTPSYAQPMAPSAAYIPSDIEIPDELSGKSHKGLWAMGLIALLVLGAFATMVISSNMHLRTSAHMVNPIDHISARVAS